MFKLPNEFPSADVLLDLLCENSEDGYEIRIEGGNTDALWHERVVLTRVWEATSAAQHAAEEAAQWAAYERDFAARNGTHCNPVDCPFDDGPHDLEF